MNAALFELIEKETGDRVVPGSLSVGVRNMSTPDAVREAIRSFAPREGWVSLTGEVIRIAGSVDIGAIDRGVVLSGEFVSADGKSSLHVRQAEAGWSVMTIERTEGGDGVIVEDSFLSESADGTRLDYEVHWKGSDESPACRPTSFRFTGFSKGGKG